MSTTVAPFPASASSVRWLQLLLGLICMMAISSPQYVWALFTKPLGASLGATAASIQVTFSILIVLQTFFSPFQGWLVERFGPRWLIAAGCALSGLSWVLAAQVSSLWGLYLTYGLVGGIGTGIVYIGVVGQMVRWFPDHRGFAAGVVAAGYGMGAIATTFPIADTLASAGLPATLMRWGLILGVIGIIAALGLKSPPVTETAASVVRGERDVAPTDMLKTPIFWLMFVMMSLMSTSGLMVTSQIGVFAADFGITQLVVWGMAALPLALTIDRFCNGLTRPFFGWVSDRIGRENTMALAFALEGLAMAAWLGLRGDPVLFVLLSGHRHVRAAARDQELRMPVYRARDRSDLRRADGLAAARSGRELDAGVRHRDRSRSADRGAGHCGAQADAGAVYRGGMIHIIMPPCPDRATTSSLW